ncbi:sulfatase-like hydrolase/transferase [Roseibacillus ishigakijimensis]|uniref:Sulfatase-like hydrolase/transferase n=1 Tax=Roseibacillus ishigakijimensis TaxID=454146 RepID=A0A934RSR9_9BACT|nr:sulfatase-like hydrolase/transferase [Roseibacillus ishigakijimensis]MBK1833550.1 sulfatase-like hydrolase/transferase [Roseibacillus ishigakijimensis]
MNALSHLFLFLFGLSSFVEVAASSSERPNIIFLMTDDQRCDNLGCYGRPEFRTENIDELAKEGVLFDKAYYAVSICMPSRVTMMTGRYLSSHQVGFSPPYNFSLSQSDFQDSYPSQLKKAGYRTGFIGKFGFTVTDEAQRPNMLKGYDFREHLTETFDFFAGDGTHTGGGSKYWPLEDETLQAIYDKDGERKTRTLRNGEAMLHFLDTQPADQPFCLSVSFLAVKHDSDSHIHRPHFDLFKDHEFSVPANWVEGANEKLPAVVRNYWRGHRLHLQRSSTPELYQRQVRRFAAQGYTVDQQIGKMMDKLAEKGLLENTIVIYTSDNGRFQGSHGLFDKALLYEESMKAPLIVFDGRVPKAQRGRRENALISSVDVAPTILSLAGLTPPDSMQGHDFSKILDQSQDLSQWQDGVFMESLFLVNLMGARNHPNPESVNEKHIAENKSYRCHGLRTDRWKYFVYYEQNPVIEELYDLENDPLEQNNLAADPQSQEVLQSLRQRTKELYAAAKK